jgi:O-antigen/teichoic acid export membrane protein
MQIEPTGPGDSEAAFQRADVMDAGGRKSHKRWLSILKTVLSFFLGQGALQAVNALVGLFLVRMLSVEAYAQFGLAFGFQTTATNLMDMGFASTIIPLIGDRVNDRDLVGKYVRAAVRLRTRAFLILAPFAVAGFVAIARTHHWNKELQILLIIPVLFALYSSGNASCYSAPFFLYRRLTNFYAPQTFSGLVRLGAYVVLQMVGGLNAWTAALISALNIAFISRVLAKRSRRWISWSNVETRSAEREIVRYVLPAMPALIFGALQPQMSLFLISIFGQTAGIAQVAALGRIAQLFSVLQVFNVVVVEPYIARLSRDRLLAVYLRLILLATVCCIPLVALAFVFPGPIIWVIGKKYEGLGKLIGWLILASCINYIAVLAWVMNRARKWVFWSGTIFEVALILVVQAAFIVFVGVRTTHEAVMFTLVSSSCLVIAHAYNAIFGFLKGPRSIPPVEEALSSLLC